MLSCRAVDDVLGIQTGIRGTRRATARSHQRGGREVCAPADPPILAIPLGDKWARSRLQMAGEVALMCQHVSIHRVSRWDTLGITAIVSLQHD